MKDYIVLEINGKKCTLGSIEIDTPNEFLLINSIEPILNNRIFDDFIDKIFFLTVNELAYEIDEKIDNVYITFLNDDEEFVCSVIIDKFKPKRSTYRMRVIDWKASGYTFKFAEEESEG